LRYLFGEPNSFAWERRVLRIVTARGHNNVSLDTPSFPPLVLEESLADENFVELEARCNLKLDQTYGFGP
jgi:hypothetical protein